MAICTGTGEQLLACRSIAWAMDRGAWDILSVDPTSVGFKSTKLIVQLQLYNFFCRVIQLLWPRFYLFKSNQLAAIKQNQNTMYYFSLRHRRIQTVLQWCGNKDWCRVPLIITSHGQSRKVHFTLNIWRHLGLPGSLHNDRNCWCAWFVASVRRHVLATCFYNWGSCCGLARSWGWLHFTFCCKSYDVLGLRKRIQLKQ